MPESNPEFNQKPEITEQDLNPIRPLTPNEFVTLMQSYSSVMERYQKQAQLMENMDPNADPDQYHMDSGALEVLGGVLQLLGQKSLVDKIKAKYPDELQD